MIELPSFSWCVCGYPGNYDLLGSGSRLTKSSISIEGIINLVPEPEAKKAIDTKRKELLNKRFLYLPTMKAKHAIVILFLGYCLDFIGGLFKIMHRSGADTILATAAILKIFGLLFFLYTLTNYPKIKDFLNS